MNTKQDEALSMERALKLALKDLERSESAMHKARAIIREALAEQPAQVPQERKQQSAERVEPVRKVYICTSCEGVYADAPVTKCDCMPDKDEFTEGFIYTSQQPSKPWVALTEYDIDQIPYSCSHADSRLIAFAIEAKLREKNAQSSKPRSKAASKPCKVWDAEGYDALCQQLEGWKAKAQRNPLTDEQIKLVMDGRGEEGDDDYVKPAFDPFGISENDLMNFARAIEAAHGIKEKNNG